MNDFDWDCAQKKRVARGARNMRVSGSPTALTPKPYTAKEIKKMNGPVYTLNPHKPMTWKALKMLPKDMQETYINGLIERFHITLNDLNYMFHIGHSTLGGYCYSSGTYKNTGIHVKQLGQGVFSSEADRAAFRAWVDAGGDQTEKKEIPEKKEEETVEEKKEHKWKEVSWDELAVAYTPEKKEETEKVVTAPPASAVNQLDELRIYGRADKKTLIKNFYAMLGLYDSGTTLAYTITLRGDSK